MKKKKKKKLKKHKHETLKHCNFVDQFFFFPLQVWQQQALGLPNPSYQIEVYYFLCIYNAGDRHVECLFKKRAFFCCSSFFWVFFNDFYLSITVLIYSNSITVS